MSDEPRIIKAENERPQVAMHRNSYSLMLK